MNQGRQVNSTYKKLNGIAGHLFIESCEFGCIKTTSNLFSVYVTMTPNENFNQSHLPIPITSLIVRSIFFIIHLNPFYESRLPSHLPLLWFHSIHLLYQFISFCSSYYSILFIFNVLLIYSTIPFNSSTLSIYHIPLVLLFHFFHPPHWLIYSMIPFNLSHSAHPIILLFLSITFYSSILLFHLIHLLYINPYHSPQPIFPFFLSIPFHSSNHPIIPFYSSIYSSIPFHSSNYPSNIPFIYSFNPSHSPGHFISYHPNPPQIANHGVRHGRVIRRVPSICIFKFNTLVPRIAIFTKLYIHIVAYTY